MLVVESQEGLDLADPVVVELDDGDVGLFEDAGAGSALWN